MWLLVGLVKKYSFIIHYNMCDNNIVVGLYPNADIDTHVLKLIMDRRVLVELADFICEAKDFNPNDTKVLIPVDHQGTYVTAYLYTDYKDNIN